LLPAFLEPRGADSFVLRVEPPLRLRAAADRASAYAPVASDYARLLEDYIRKYPLQWRGWVEHGNWKQSGDSEE
jgi:hypothetical protein